jgi:hypothetical protein
MHTALARRAAAGAIVLLVFGTSPSAAPPPTGPSGAGRPKAAGEWLQFRADRRLTGRSTLKGKMRSPQIRWRQFIGSRETLLAVTFQRGEPRTTALPTADFHADQSAKVLAEWKLTSPFETSSNHRTGRFLPGRAAAGQARVARAIHRNRRARRQDPLFRPVQL